MAVENDFVPFATGPSANVMPLATYQAAPQTANGVATGIADSTIYNRSMRQATFVAAAMATFSVKESGLPAKDDGNLNEFVANFTSAILQIVAGGGSGPAVPLFATNAQALAGTSTNTIIAPASLNYVLAQKCLLLTGGSLTGNLTVGGALVVGAGLTVAGGFVLTTGAITLPAGSLSGAALAPGSVPLAALPNIPAHDVLGNPGPAAGPPQAVSLASMLAAAGTPIPTYAHFQQRTPSSTNYTGGAKTQRPLDTADPLNASVIGIAGAALSGGGQVTLPIGIYKATAHGTARPAAGQTDMVHQLSVRNVGTGVAVVIGANDAYSVGGGNTDIVSASLQGLFQLTAAGSVALDTWVTYTSDDGISGVPSSPDPDVWADLMLEKIG